jgi:hypothetical protein
MTEHEIECLAVEMTEHEIECLSVEMTEHKIECLSVEMTEHKIECSSVEVTEHKTSQRLWRNAYNNFSVLHNSGVAKGGVWGVQTPPKFRS